MVKWDKHYLMLLFAMISLIWRSSSLMIRSSWVYTPVLNKVSLSSISRDKKSSKPSSCLWDPEKASLGSATFPVSGACFLSSCSLNLKTKKGIHDVTCDCQRATNTLIKMCGWIALRTSLDMTKCHQIPVHSSLVTNAL